jgi:hypothetical protein
MYANELGDAGPDDAEKSDSGKEAEREWGKVWYRGDEGDRAGVLALVVGLGDGGKAR